MPEFYYDKVVRGYKLSEELKAAGYLVETVYSEYNYDDPPASEPYCKVVLADSETKDPTAIVEAHDPYTGLPEEKYQEQLVAEFNTAHEQAILALKNWDSLTAAQKYAILKGLVKWALWKDGWLKLGVL